jgi:hypothetical protein
MMMKSGDIRLQGQSASVDIRQIENLTAMLGGKAKRAGFFGLFTGQRD